MFDAVPRKYSQGEGSSQEDSGFESRGSSVARRTGTSEGKSFQVCHQQAELSKCCNHGTMLLLKLFVILLKIVVCFRCLRPSLGRARAGHPRTYLPWREAREDGPVLAAQSSQYTLLCQAGSEAGRAGRELGGREQGNGQVQATPPSQCTLLSRAGSRNSITR